MGQDVVDYGSAVNDGTGDALHIAFAKIDAGARSFTVLDKDLTAPPGTPTVGDVYIVAAAATGDWSGQDGNLAVFGLGSTWLFVTAAEGMVAYAVDEDAEYRHDGAAWTITGGGAAIKATDAQVRSSAAGDLYVAPEVVESASALVALTDGANIALNWDTAINATVTLAGNRTLDNPLNGQIGTWRTVIVKQDATGSRTLSFGSAYKFAGGTAPTLTTAAAAEDVLSIFCQAADRFLVFSALDLK